MPILLAEIGTTYVIARISGREKDRHYLESLGFVPKAEILVLSKFNNYVIVNIKGARIGISGDLAKRVII